MQELKSAQDARRAALISARKAMAGAASITGEGQPGPVRASTAPDSAIDDQHGAWDI